MSADSTPKRLQKLVEKASSPVGTLVYRGLMTAGFTILITSVGIFNLGLKTRAEQVLADSEVVKTATAKAEEATRRVSSLERTVRERDAEMSVNMSRIAETLKLISEQQLKVSTQQAANTTAIAVLTSHASDVDRTVDRQQNAIETLRARR